MFQVDTTAAAGVGTVGFIVGYVVKNVVPLLTSWLFKQWNTAQTSWYARQSNPVKMAVYVGATVALMLLFSLVGLGWDHTTDAENLTPDLIQSFIMALISTLLVKVGIRTEQQKRENTF